jgi:hypothetical protein
MVRLFSWVLGTGKAGTQERVFPREKTSTGASENLGTLSCLPNIHELNEQYRYSCEHICLTR